MLIEKLLKGLCHCRVMFIKLKDLLFDDIHNMANILTF